MEAANLNNLWGRLIVEELVRQGVRQFVISPGSRSTPLTVAAAQHPGVATHIFHDERGAGFFALGLARASAHPAALICTSGTAGAHYLPALIEAHMDGLPMLVLQADRPAELQETGANQTVPQTAMFTPYLRWGMALPAPSLQVPVEMLLTTVAQAVQRALHPWPGPVHLNCPFREPLAPIPEALPSDYTAGLSDWEAGQDPFTRLDLGRLVPDAAVLDRLARQLQAVARGLVVVGRLPLGTPAGPLIALLQKLGWPVLADVTSGLRIPALQPWLVGGYDALLAHPDWQNALAPEMALHFGAAPTSKRLLQFLQVHRPSEYVLIHPSPQRIDPNHQVTWRLVGDVSVVAEGLQERIDAARDAPWLQVWKAREQAVRQCLSRHVAEAEEDCFTELHLVARLSTRLPEQATLFLGSSMP
ncbi:MAG: 2-succinyl-5-enolpyruvyl-6-hydroxy-3-cyclohexene-1-carboxylic-acid synthase, partial [Calditrichaeota bacterium]